MELGDGVVLLNYPQDNGKSGPGPVASRALELNGVSSTSDGGEDTGSQGGSESDTSRTDGRQNTRAASAKKPTTFKPVTFAKFSVPKAPGAAAPPKAGDKGTFPPELRISWMRSNLCSVRVCHHIIEHPSSKLTATLSR